MQQTKQFQKLFQTLLLDWFDKHGRKNLPWQGKNAYFVWISEIMLQQTQVIKVVDYFGIFIKKFPTVQSLAQAEVSDVLQLWSGLGYYNRARNIHKTAIICAQEYNGKLPKELKQLIDLPGVGRTTAAAILSLSANKPHAILDGNVKRVMSRVFKVKADKFSQLDKKLWLIVDNCISVARAKDYNQGLMDLGSMICKRSKPLCDKCPLIKICQANRDNEIALYPQKKPKTKQLPVTLHALLYQQDNKILLQQRKDKGIWAELWFLPLFETSTELKQISGKQSQFEITHILSHRILTIKVTVVNKKIKSKISGKWIDKNILDEIPHPSALEKVLNQEK